MRGLLERMSHVFANGDRDPGRVNGVEHGMLLCAAVVLVKKKECVWTFQS